MRRVAFLVWKELIELKEDPRRFAIVIVAPIVQLVMLGYAATTDVRNVPVVIADADRLTASRDLIPRFSASRNFSVVSVVASPDDVDPYLVRGRAWMALAIPARFGERLVRHEPQALQIVADGSDASSINIALGYATNLLAGYAEDVGAGEAGGAGQAGGAGGIEARVRVWFNPRLESRDFMLPGILALLLLAITTNLSSMGIVREREIGTLEQLNVTPLRRWELILGKLLPYALVGMIDVCLVLSVAVFWFQVPLRGSVMLLFALMAVYLRATVC